MGTQLTRKIALEVARLRQVGHYCFQQHLDISKHVNSNQYDSWLLDTFGGLAILTAAPLWFSTVPLGVLPLLPRIAMCRDRFLHCNCKYEFTVFAQSGAGGVPFVGAQ